MPRWKTRRATSAFLALVFLSSLVACRAGDRVGERGPDAASVEDQAIHVALCQIFCLDGDRSGNFARIENAVSEAKKGGADIACLPETAILGWVNPDAHSRAHPIPGEDSERLCGLAARHRIFLAIGLAEKNGDRLYDTVILIDDNGRILLKHRKINILSELMAPPYTPGEEIRTAETRFGRIGLLVCADTFKGELLERMASLKPDLVLVPYGWAAEEGRWPEHGKQLERTVVNAARKMGATVIGTDLVGEITHGPWTGLVYGGQSVAADAGAGILGVAADRDREIMIVRVPLKQRRPAGRPDQ